MSPFFGSCCRRQVGLRTRFAPATRRVGRRRYRIGARQYRNRPVRKTIAGREGAKSAAATGLIYVSDSEPGIRRRRRGSSFYYVSPADRILRSKAVLRRIASLAVPPAYEDVWICTNPRGHIQATGRDARGRKQYRYHARWREVRDLTKFDRMVDFGRALPKLRQRLQHDLGRRGLPRDKVLAVIVSMLDSTRARIGNAEYARNNSFGLSTLRNQHVEFVRDGRALLRFRGKGGTRHEITVDDKRLARLVKRCQELPGQQLFQYVDDDGARCPVGSRDVNDYLRQAMEGEFTAKDFRTWGATMEAVALLSRTPLPAPPSDRACKARIARVVRQVAKELHNTPAVCRKSYINPAVFEAWRRGKISGGSSARSERKILSLLARLK
jgi:DNA topoisomerase I